MFGKASDPGEADARIRDVLKAASARPEELPAVSPAFATRVLARGRAEARSEDAHPFGAAARSLLPALSAAVLLLAAVTTWQSLEVERERMAVVASLGTQKGQGDLLLAVVFLGDGSERTPR